MRCFVIMLMWLALSAKADSRDSINWLAGLPEQGIPVSDRDWLILASNPSPEKLNKLVRRYAGYVDRGRLDRRLFQPGWRVQEEKSVLPENGWLTLAYLKSLEPQLPQYKMLVRSLARLKVWSQTASDEFPDDLIFFEGDQHPSVARLNAWLMDLDLIDSLVGDVYTQTHKDVLTQVQLQFDLGPDGRLGVLTRQALLAITHDRIRTVKANLERLRWLPSTLPYPHIKVDIAGFNVAWAPRASKQFIHKAIIGTRHKQTPIFNDEIESITYNPVWKVPHSIAASSMLRAEKKEPGFLKKEGFVVYENWEDRAPVVPIESIRWQGLTPRTFRYRLEQQPGKVNRLGRFKLDLPNQYGVYLHDTDKPELFEKNRRSFSSGCTRVEGIAHLVNSILSMQSIEHDPEASEALTHKVALNQTIPIYFLYFTAWPDDSGRVRFREDIYQLDHAMTSWF